MLDANSRDKLLQVRNVNKAFFGNTVLNNVSFEMEHGQVLGLIGQNGAGKSTLVKILTGAYKMDSGTVLIEGNEVKLDSIQSANNSGIALVFQELSLASNMTVADNIFVGNLPTGALNLVKKTELYEATQKLIDEFQVDFKPDDKVEDLTMGKRQIVEIMKAISKDPKILILDEPTSSLEDGEIKILFNFIRQVKSKGYSIIYISHHMSEIFEIVDKILILRDGKNIKECPIGEIKVRELISLMIGQEYNAYNGIEAKRNIKDEVALDVKNLTNGKYFDNLSFKIGKGEILGIAGIIGCGKTELCETIYGARKAESGEILVDGKKSIIKNPSDSKELGILCIPENRKSQGLFINDTVKNNIISCVLKKMCNKVFLQKNKIDSMITNYQKDLNIKMTSPDQIIRFLSGGNQQKVLVAKCIADDPKVLIAMDPTRGIDVSAKADIHRILHELSENGLSVLMISSELNELINMCDRILVMNTGKIIDEFERKNFNEAEILLSMHRNIEQGGDYNYGKLQTN